MNKMIFEMRVFIRPSNGWQTNCCRFEYLRFGIWKKDIKTGIINAWVSYGAVRMKLFAQNGSYEEFHSKSSWEHGSELMDINMY